MIGRLLGRELAERLPGEFRLWAGSPTARRKILRVHDVAASRDIVKVYELTC